MISRFVISVIGRTSMTRAIRSIQRYPLLAHKYSEDLDMPYGKKENFGYNHFTTLQDYLKNIKQLGDYQLLYSIAYDADHILVFVKLSYDDFGVGFTGSGTDVKKQVIYNFLLKYSDSEKALLIQSDIYSNSTEKFQKEAFMNALLNGA
jgi:hypothetical protein